VAARVLAEVDPSAPSPKSVRETGIAPFSVRPEDLEVELPKLVDAELSAVDGGTVAVLVPAGRSIDLPEDERVSVLTVERAKGLEFDSVLVVAPDEIVAGSPRGLNDLYVALTRTTRRLGVVLTGDEVPALSVLG
jgi:hypothetical protein